MITIEFNDAQVIAALAKISAHLDDLSPLMNRIGLFMVTTTENRFARTEAPDGSQWAPRSETTIKHYGRTGQRFGPVLHKTGELSQSIFHRYDATSTTIASNLRQSAVMQFGAAKAAFGPRTPWGNIPARPYIGMSETDRVGILERVDTWLAGIAAA